MNAHDVDTALAIVLASDFRDQIETASTLPPPPAAFLNPCGKYTECAWRFDPGDSNLIDVTLSGYVDGDEVRAFAVKDANGNPVRIQYAFMCDALTDLVIAARGAKS